jgi:cystathionine beta-lyase/cystathionine gamma-synthase
MASRAFETKAVHAGERKQRGEYTPVSTPIYNTVGYIYESMAKTDAVLGSEEQGYIYPRYGSPTVAAFEAAAAELEGAPAAQAYPSGMAAVLGALLSCGVKSGARVVGAHDVYGATYTLLRGLLADLGVQVQMVDAADIRQVEAAVSNLRPCALLVETISNPILKVADIPALREVATQYGAQLLVDNTFATPYLCNPYTLGADFVIHSATKYLGGHGDLMAGVVVASEENRRRMAEMNKMVGGVLGPFDAWLALRGIKTLPLRIQRQCENALSIARWLSEHPKVMNVLYPGLTTHPQHDLAGRLFKGRGYGGVLSFEIKPADRAADRAAVFRFIEALELCLPATTLGDVYTLVLHPATASHRGLTPEERASVGIPEGLVRLSAGIEAVDDILADLAEALDQV